MNKFTNIFFIVLAVIILLTMLYFAPIPVLISFVAAALFSYFDGEEEYQDGKRKNKRRY